MTTDTTGTNGLLISPDQRTLYMIQTSPERRELRAYDIQDDGSLGHYIVLHQLAKTIGDQRGIDGMCLDAEGNIVHRRFLCQWSWPNDLHLGYKGRVLETHPMPVGVDTPTNCTFGDPDQGTLYITTGGGHLSGSATRDDAAGSSGRRCGRDEGRGTRERRGREGLSRPSPPRPLPWERELQSNTPT